MLTLLSQFQAQGWEIRLSRIRFAVQTLLSKIIPIASSVKTKFDYFVGGCFTDGSTLVHFPATGDHQFNKQHQGSKG
jgi:hypothetical protein